MYKPVDVTLQQVQETELEMLDEVIRLCQKHDLHFAMLGGSCLGAVRHKGMIPWDDDIDVGMDRKDYERFVEICKSELDPKYFFQHFQSEPNCGYLFGKLRKNNTRMTEAYSQDVKMHHGVWIDIFPLDYVPDDLPSFRKNYRKVLFYRNLLLVKLGFHVKEDASAAVKASYAAVRAGKSVLSVPKLKQKLTELMTQQDAMPTDTLFPYGCAWGERERMTKDDFYDVVWVSFNGRKVPIFRSFDAYLTRMYGDYMTYPPKEKRRSEHDLSQVQL